MIFKDICTKTPFVKWGSGIKKAEKKDKNLKMKIHSLIGI